MQNHTSRSHASRSFPVRPLLIVGSLVAGLVVWSRLHAAPRVPVALIVGVDASGSMRDHNEAGANLLGQSRFALSQACANLDPATDFLLLLRVDRQTTPFFQGPPIAGSDKTLDLLLNETQPITSRAGTFPAPFWTLAARQASDARLVPGCAIEVVLYSDGDNDDLRPDSDRAIIQAGRDLAANPRVKGVWIFGIKRENWTHLTTLLAPLEGRLHLATRTKMAPAPLLQDVAKARRALSVGVAPTHP